MIYDFGFGVSVVQSPGRDEYSCDVFDVINSEDEDGI